MIGYHELSTLSASILQQHYDMLSRIDIARTYKEIVEFIKESDIKAKISSLAFGTVGVFVSLHVSKSDNIQSPLPYAMIDAVSWLLIGFGVGIIFNPNKHLESLKTFNNSEALPQPLTEDQPNIVDNNDNELLELNYNLHNINPEL